MNIVKRLQEWSRGNITEEAAKQFAASYLNGTLGEGLIKSYLDQVSLSTCNIPTCDRPALDKYCPACLALEPGSAAANLLSTMGEFLSAR